MATFPGRDQRGRQTPSVEANAAEHSTEGLPDFFFQADPVSAWSRPSGAGADFSQSAISQAEHYLPPRTSGDDDINMYLDLNPQEPGFPHLEEHGSAGKSTSSSAPTDGGRTGRDASGKAVAPFHGPRNSSCGAASSCGRGAASNGGWGAANDGDHGSEQSGTRGTELNEEFANGGSRGPSTPSEKGEDMEKGDNSMFDDADIKKLKKYVYELELANSKLKQNLEEAESKLKEMARYMNADPEIELELLKCHDVFLCTHESGFRKLEELLSEPGSKITKAVKVPGKEAIKALKQFEKDLPLYRPPGVRNRKKDKEFRRMTTLAKIVILGIIEDIYRLHRHGLSLDGKFDLKNFFWTDLKKVKLDPALKPVASKRDRGPMINDYHQIYQIVLQILLIHDDGLPVPDDLQRLLNLLNSEDPVKFQHIIRYNMSLMSEIGKKCHFITLYDRLRQLICEERENSEKVLFEGEGEKDSEKVLLEVEGERKDSEKVLLKGVGEKKDSEKVLDFLESYLEKHKEAWSTMAVENMHVKATYDLRFLKKRGQPLTGALNLLIVWRNALSHVLEDSVKGDKALFKDEDLVNILESTVPGVFNVLQQAMNEVGLLELPHLIRAMRM